MPARHHVAAASASVPPRRHAVTAVLVSHDGLAWLPSSLAALDTQTRPPDRVVAVDTGSTDGSADLLAAHLGGGRVVRAGRTTGFGAAVARGLAELDPSPGDAAAALPNVRAETAEPPPTVAATAEPAPAEPAPVEPAPVEWVWLLHDDCAPAPDALERMLDLAELNPSAAVVGPKLRDWDNHRLLLEVGLGTDPAGHRYAGLDRREVDQGQHDGVGEVLAVGSAGALVRRDVWDALGGYDPRLPLFRDDVDFGWRARLAGHRVLVATAAVVYHAEATASGRRTPHAVTGRPARLDRAHGLYAVVANAGPVRATAAVPLLAVGTVLRVAGYLLTRRARAAADEVLAYLALIAALPVLLAGAPARRRRRARRLPPRAVRPLLVHRRARLRAVLDRLGDRLARDHDGPAALADLPVEPGLVGDDAVEAAPVVPRWRRLLLRPGPLLFLGLSAVAVIAERRVIGGGLLAGGRLLPPLGGASDLWSAYLTSWHDVGLGSTTAAPPYLAGLAVLSSVLFGKVWLAVDVLLLGAVPLAGLTAYLATRRTGAPPPMRAWAAAAYALLPTATGAVAGGRLGEAVGFVLLPVVLATAAAASRAARRRGDWRHAWAAGLALTVAVAFAPPLYPVALAAAAGAGVLGLAGVVTGVVARGGRRPALRRGVGGARVGLRTVATAVLVVAVPAALLAPWTAAVWRDPAPLLLGVGHGAAGPRVAPRPVDLLLAQPGGPGLPPVWLYAAVLAAGLTLALRADRRGTTAVVWWLVAAALGVGVLQGRTGVVPAGGGPRLLGWPGAAAAVVGAALVLGALLAAAGAPGRLATRSFGWGQPLAAVLAVLCAATPVAAAALWAASGVHGPLHVVRGGDVLPTFVTADLAASPGARALVLRGEPDGSVGYLVVGGAGRTSLLTAELRPAAAGQDELARAVRALVGGPANGAARLATMGIRYVVTAGHDAALGAVLDGQPGLSRSTADAGVNVWRDAASAGGLAVLPPSLAGAALAGGTPPAGVTRGPVRLPMTGSRTTVRLAAGPAGRLLVLPTPAQDGWHATLDGRPLAPRVGWGWAQAFAVPAAGGELVVRHGGHRSLELWLELAAALLVAVLAAPGVRRDERPGTGPAPAGVPALAPAAVDVAERARPAAVAGAR